MNAVVKGTVIGAAGALLLGASLALSSATVVSGASRIHPLATPTFPNTIKCKKLAPNSCLTVQNRKNGNAIDGVAAKGIGVSGSSTHGIGVDGSSSRSVGVYGESKGVNSAGVAGDGTSSSDGVYGISSSGNGVEGLSSHSDGVYGSSSSSAGVFGYSKSGYGGWFEDDNTEYVALWAQDDQGTSGIPFVARGESGSKSTGEFYVDGSGNGFFTGEVAAQGGFTTVIRSRIGESFGASAALTPQATMEDTGTSRLLNGEGAVRFDSALASTIDASRGYQVFLTPNGDTRGLYVSAKYEGGFIVRENEHGRSSVSFDYRVVAHPFGASDVRLPRLNIKPPNLSKPPPIMHPQL
jgi:hypothetical protein